MEEGRKWDDISSVERLKDEGHTAHLLQALCHMLNYTDLYADVSHNSTSL